MTGTASGEFATRTRSSRTKVVRAAYRHSLLVRTLRIALPAAAVLTLAGIVAAIVFDPRVLLASQMDVESTSLSGSRIVMQRPRLTGYGTPDDKGQSKPYEITAERAEQNMAKPDEIDLFELKAKTGMREAGWAELRATSGHMDNTAQILDLFKDVQVKTDLNDRAALTQARVDFGKGEITSDQRVDIKLQRADIVADAMHLFENGQRAVFTGRVSMVLKPDPALPVTPLNLRAAQ